MWWIVGKGSCGRESCIAAVSILSHACKNNSAVNIFTATKSRIHFLSQTDKKGGAWKIHFFYLFHRVSFIFFFFTFFLVRVFGVRSFFLGVCFFFVPLILLIMKKKEKESKGVRNNSRCFLSVGLHSWHTWKIWFNLFIPACHACILLSFFSF